MKIVSTYKMFFVVVALIGAGCRSSHTSLDESARAWQDAVNSKNTEALLTYFADDSVAFYPRPQPSLSKAVIRKNWTELFQLKNISHPITTDKVITDASGDLGYVVGSWRASYDDNEGHYDGGGKYLAVWQRKAGGPWRIVAMSANEYEEPKNNLPSNR